MNRKIQQIQTSKPFATRPMAGSFARLLAASSLCAVCLVGGQNAQADDNIPGHVLVRVQPGTDIRSFAAGYRATIRDGVPNRGVYDLAPPTGTTDQAFVQRLATDLRVIYSEQNTYIDSPEVNGNPFHFAFDKGPSAGLYVNSTAYTQIHFGKTASLATGKGVIVAVLDTGATFDHPALKGHYLPGYNAINPSLPPNDVADGFSNQGYGHGTMIAGIIARLAPNASIMPIRVLNGDGFGTMFDVAKGIDYAVTHGARVLNMSFGALPTSSALNDTLDQAEAAGIVLVASAGNDNLRQVLAPAKGHGALAVASVEANYTKSSYSNYDSAVRVVAPGTGIRSTFPGGGYATWSGTSFAAPFVSAQAALMLSASSRVSGDKVVSLIRNTAISVDKYNPAYRGRLGNGMIDIETAVKSAR